jgi:ArsR family transcriptional regulator
VTASTRATQFHVLGDEDRLRLLALCAEEELTVGELAARRDGTRTLLRAQRFDRDPVLEAALDEGRILCGKDGSLARVPAIVAQREEASRRFFEDAPIVDEPRVESELVQWLPLLAPLLPGRALAIDLGTGDGTLLPLLSPLFERVIAVDRSPAQLARASAKVATRGLPNVRLREGDVEDAGLVEDVARRGGADLVVMARVLHHAGNPHAAVIAATRLVRPGGHLAIADYLPHDDEAMREQGDVWLGFPPAKLRGWLDDAQLEDIAVNPFPHGDPPLQLAIGRKPSRTN